MKLRRSTWLRIFLCTIGLINVCAGFTGSQRIRMGVVYLSCAALGMLLIYAANYMEKNGD